MEKSKTRKIQSLLLTLILNLLGRPVSHNRRDGQRPRHRQDCRPHDMGGHSPSPGIRAEALTTGAQ